MSWAFYTLISNKEHYWKLIRGVMTNLQLYDASALARHRSWLDLSDEALRRRAVAAANSRDPEELWGLVEAYLVHSSPKGSKLSRHTLNTYKRGVRDLLEHWQGVNLLRPSRRRR